MRSYILLSLLPMVLMGCTLTGGSSITSTGSMSPVMTGKVSYTEEIQKASPKIKDSSEFNDCMRPSVNMCLNQVGSQMARAQKSEAFCDEIVDIGSREGCRFGVVMVKAIESKNIGLCDTLIDTNKHQCRSSVIVSEAVEKKDMKICEKLLDGTPKTDATKNNLNTPIVMQLDQCKMSVLQVKSNPVTEDCDVFSEKSIKDMCFVITKSHTSVPLVQPSGNKTKNPVSAKKTK